MNKMQFLVFGISCLFASLLRFAPSYVYDIPGFNFALLGSLVVSALTAVLMAYLLILYVVKRREYKANGFLLSADGERINMGKVRVEVIYLTFGFSAALLSLVIHIYGLVFLQ